LWGKAVKTSRKHLRDGKKQGTREEKVCKSINEDHNSEDKKERRTKNASCIHMVCTTAGGSGKMGGSWWRVGVAPNQQ